MHIYAYICMHVRENVRGRPRLPASLRIAAQHASVVLQADTVGAEYVFICIHIPIVLVQAASKEAPLDTMPPAPHHHRSLSLSPHHRSLSLSPRPCARHPFSLQPTALLPL